MKLYDGGRAPNPRRVRIFLSEKGVEVPLESIDMEQMGHKSDLITTKNPLQRLPILELDDGTIISESVAICRYIEEQHPSPALMGIDAVDKSLVEMWQRRIEFYLFAPIAHVFRHSHPAMAEWEVPQILEFAESNKSKVLKFMEWLNTELAHRPFISGERYTIADITALVALDFLKPAKLSIPEELEVLSAWHTKIRSRDSSKA